MKQLRMRQRAGSSSISSPEAAVIRETTAEVKFSRFSGPADERTSDITVDGVVVGYIEGLVTYVDNPTSATPLAIHTTGYSVTLFDAPDGRKFEDREFLSLKAARWYARGVVPLAADICMHVASAA